MSDLIAGVDEAGRGALAGPVVAGAVVLRESSIHPYRDSKQLTATQREQMATRLLESEALAWGIGWASEDEIDRWNILEASCRAMERAIMRLGTKPQRVIADGRVRLRIDVPYESIPKADATVRCVSAASILAKVFRDRWMVALDSVEPQFGFAGHKGYGAASHLAAIAQFGPGRYHRRTFAPIRQYPLGIGQ